MLLRLQTTPRFALRNQFSHIFWKYSPHVCTASWPDYRCRSQIDGRAPRDNLQILPKKPLSLLQHGTTRLADGQPAVWSDDQTMRDVLQARASRQDLQRGDAHRDQSIATLRSCTASGSNRVLVALNTCSGRTSCQYADQLRRADKMRTLAAHQLQSRGFIRGGSPWRAPARRAGF